MFGLFGRKKTVQAWPPPDESEDDRKRRGEENERMQNYMQHQWAQTRVRCAINDLTIDVMPGSHQYREIIDICWQAIPLVRWRVGNSSCGAADYVETIYPSRQSMSGNLADAIEHAIIIKNRLAPVVGNNLAAFAGAMFPPGSENHA